MLDSKVLHNPVRDPPGVGGTYAGLAVTAIRAPGGDLHLLVVNRLPFLDVTLEVSTRQIGASSFVSTFPATSTTVIRVPSP